jgi:REP element-mobilizing transposase RayT
MGQEYRRTSITVSLINYHFVFCPRYRRKALIGEVDKRFREILQDICDENDLIIVAIEVIQNHVHLVLYNFNQSIRYYGKQAARTSRKNEKNLHGWSSLSLGSVYRIKGNSGRN